MIYKLLLECSQLLGNSRIGRSQKNLISVWYLMVLSWYNCTQLLRIDSYYKTIRTRYNCNFKVHRMAKDCIAK